LAPASVVTIVVGQNSFFTAAIVLGGIVLLDRRPWLAGVLFGLLVVKPHLVLLVPVALVAVGAWRTIASAALTAGLLVAASAAIWGVDPWIAWWTKTCAQVYLVLAQFEQFHTFMMPSVLVFASARAIGLSPAAANIVQAVAALSVALTTLLIFRQTRDVACARSCSRPARFSYRLRVQLRHDSDDGRLALGHAISCSGEPAGRVDFRRGLGTSGRDLVHASTGSGRWSSLPFLLLLLQEPAGCRVRWTPKYSRHSCQRVIARMRDEWHPV